MQIKSFLLHTSPNSKQQVIESLSFLDNCEIVPSENCDVLVVALENHDDEEADRQILQIENTPGVKLLTMVFGATV